MAQFTLGLTSGKLRLANVPTNGQLITGYTVNFSTLPAQDLKAGGDGAKVIDGKTWALVNSANASTVYLNDGTHAGIYIRCNNADTDDFNNRYDGPRMVAPIVNLAPAVDPRSCIEHQVWFMFSQPHTPNANFEFMRLGVQPYPCLPDNTGQYVRVNAGRGFFNVGLSTGASFQNGGVTVDSSTLYFGNPGPNYDVAVFRMFPSFMVDIYEGNSVGGNFPNITALTLVGRGQLTTNPPGWDISPRPSAATVPGWAVHFNCTTKNLLGNADLLIQKLMYKYRA